MALTKQQKKEAMQKYVSLAKNAKNIALVVEKSVKVNDINTIRKNIAPTGGKVCVVKKRIFIKAMEEAGFEHPDIGKVDGTILALYAPSTGDEYALIKEIEKMNKVFKKEARECSFTYLGGWYDMARKDAKYVTMLATLPSKEELLAKFLFLLKYPIQSFTSVIDKIRQKKEGEK